MPAVLNVIYILVYIRQQLVQMLLGRVPTFVGVRAHCSQQLRVLQPCCHARLFSSKGKPKLTFKQARKLLKLRPRSVPYRERQKRGMLMNFAEYAVRNPFESYWSAFVTQRLDMARASLDDIFKNGGRTGVILQMDEKSANDAEQQAAASGGEARSLADLAATLPGDSPIKDCYSKAGGDTSKLLELMQAEHAEHAKKYPDP